MGKAAIAGKESVTNQQINAVIVETDDCPLYIYYELSTRKSEIRGSASGSAQPILNKSAFGRLPISLPSPTEQRAIAHILGTLDDKIELNRRTNETLEAMARAIFKSWFVDFDPVRAKASGEPPESICRRLGFLAEHLALFPDGLVETEIGWAPKGWQPAMLKELTSKIGSGATPRGGSEVYVPEGVALIRSQNVYNSEFIWDGLARLTDDAARQLANVDVQPQDVLINITGASILRTCVVPNEVLPARVNQHVSIIRAKPGVPPHFLHQHLLRPEIKDWLLGMNAGGSREAVTKGHLEAVKILSPSPELLALFSRTVAPLHIQAELMAEQNRPLATLRDALLAKLLSGEMRPAFQRETISV